MWAARADGDVTRAEIQQAFEDYQIGKMGVL
jgi:hypothetical protein